RALGMEFSKRKKSEHQENQECRKLRDLEWRLCLRWRQCVKLWDFLERLYDTDKRIEIERHDGGNDINPAPRTRKAFAVERTECDREHEKRNRADDVRGHDAHNREAVAGDAREHGREQEKPGPTLEQSAAEHAEQSKEPGSNSDQTQNRVQRRKGRKRHPEDHGFPPVPNEAMLRLSRGIRHMAERCACAERPRSTPSEIIHLADRHALVTEDVVGGG